MRLKSLIYHSRRENGYGDDVSWKMKININEEIFFHVLRTRGVKQHLVKELRFLVI